MMSARAESTSLNEVRFNFFVVVTAEPYSFSVTVTCDGLPSAMLETSEDSGKSSIKIDWDSDSKNHLYFILKELKNAGLIKNSLPDLAIFVKENIPLFSNKSLTSIRDAIQKGVEPKRGSIETVKIIKKIRG